FRDRRSRKVKRVKSYTIKFKGADGEWITEATDATQKHVAERLLLQREREVQQGQGGGLPSVVPAPSPGEGALPVPLADLVARYLPWFRLRARPYTVLRREEYLRGTLQRLPVRTAADLKLPVVHGYVEKRLAAGIAEATLNCEIRYLKKVMDYAVDEELIPSNPLARWRPLKEQARRK